MRLAPIRWPDNARITVVVEVGFSAWPDDLGTPGSPQGGIRQAITPQARFPKDLAVITDRQFGDRAGIFRLLDLLQRERVPATFFISGATIAAFPKLIQEIDAAGHEVAAQNYRHHLPHLQATGECRQDLEQTVATWEHELGRRPRGYVSAGLWATDETPQILADLGFRYWMDLLHEELPYTLRLASGQELVVLAHSAMHTADAFQHGMKPRTAIEMGQLWRDWFDFLYEEGTRSPGLFAITIHPEMVGRPPMALALQAFLRHVRAHAGVWLTTCDEVASWWWDHYRTSHVELWPNYGTAVRRRLV